MKCLFRPLGRFAISSLVLFSVICWSVLPIVSADDLSWNQEESTSESSACNNKFQLVSDFVHTEPFSVVYLGADLSDFVTKGMFSWWESFRY